MAVRMQGYRAAAKEYGGFQKPAPAASARRPLDVKSIANARTAITRFEKVSDIAGELVKQHPYMKALDIARIAYRMYRTAAPYIRKTKTVHHEEPQLVLLNGPDLRGWVVVCAGGGDPVYPYPGGWEFFPAVGLAAQCGLAAQSWPRTLSEFNPGWGYGTGWLWDWGTFFGGIAELARINTHVELPIGVVPEGLPQIERSWVLPKAPWITRDNPLEWTPPVPLTMPWRVSPIIEPAWPSERGNEAPQPKGMIDPVPNAGPQPVAAPALRARPGPKRKEIKFAATKFNQAIAKAVKSSSFVLEKLTDLRDIVNALNESLPKDLQIKSKSLPTLIGNVYRHADRLQAGAALVNIVKELAEDVIGGTGDMLSSEAAKRNGWSKQKFHLSPRF